MGKKKPKEAENSAKNESSSAPSIFKTLFGDISQQDASTSIFSDSNPFRRKPGDRARRFDSDEADEVPGNGGSDDPVVVEVKKRRRNGEGKAGVGSDSTEEGSENVFESKKAKKDKRKSHGSGFKLNGESKKDGAENHDLDFELSGRSRKDEGDLDSNGTSKKEKGKNPNLRFVVKGIESLEIDREDQNGVSNTGKEKRKEKKRKRDEIEREYEERHYGAPEEAEGGLGGRVVGEKRKTVDNPAEMLVSKEGFDDESKLLRTVFVGNLPLKVKKKALLKEFSQFGEIESLRIRSVPLLDSKIPRKGAIMKKKINDSIDSVHAYIVFKMEQSVEASLVHNMSVIGGNHIRVDRACPPRKKLKGENAPLYDNKRTVFVGNLPFDVKDEEIYQLFCSINYLESSIEAVRVIRDPHTSVGKGIAYVLFKTRDAANLVVKKQNLKLRDRDLRLCHAKSNSTPSKRKNPSPSGANKSPAKKLAVDAISPRDGDGRGKTKAAISYQGLRASKSGVPKKVRSQTSVPLKSKSSTPKGKNSKERQHKRPAVAARKAKAKGNALKSSSTSKIAGKKRKLGSRTPDSSHQNRKAKKLR